METTVREALARDAEGIAEVIRSAFPGAEGVEIDELVANLVVDPTARPLISLVADVDSRVVGHVLFTSVKLVGSPVEMSAMILAPLAVHPDFQGQGIGASLIREGLEIARAAGIDLVFVLGWPDYYPRHGFLVAGERGFEASYPIAEEQAGAWMVQELRSGIIEQGRGRVVCAESLMDPKYWTE